MGYAGNLPTYNSFPSDLFTGNGSNTNFTMSSVPGNDAALLVTIDGVRQHTDTYSYSSNTLIFSEAPPSGAVIETVNMGSRADVIVTDGVYRKTQFTATNAQTNFNVATGYTVGFVDVYLNGIRLVVADDYTATDGSTIILAVPATTGDSIEVVAYGTFNVANALQKSGDIMSGNFVVTGTSTLNAPVAIANTTGNTVTFATTGAVTFNSNTTVAGTATFNGSVVTSGAIQFNGATLNTNSNWGSFINPKSGGSVGDFTITRPDGAISWLSIDSSGRVTKPYQPAFFVRPATDPTNGVVISTLVDINVGNHYSTSTGRFTAPITGTYYFSAITNGGVGTNAIALRFRKNQVTVPGFQAYIMNTDDSPNISGIMYLTAGDYIDLVTDVTSIASTPWTHFCGYLVG